METNRKHYFGGIAIVLGAAVLAIGLVPAPVLAQVGIIQGTMSNFDVFNETSVNVYGAEIELEGCLSTDVNKTYPAHFSSMVKTDYSSGISSGTRLTFTGYTFDPSGYMIPRVGQSTNGHFAVNLPGCEHFGFSIVGTQPTTTRFFWLDQPGNRIGTKPMSIPNATWTYNPPAVPGGQWVMQAVVVPPAPEIPEAMLPDSIWMKVYVTEMDRPVDLGELISGPGTVAPQSKAEIEKEWVLLEGGVPEQGDSVVGPNAQSVLRRYEYFKYTGPVDPTDNAPLSSWNLVGEPPANELGDFIAANMVAANLADPPCRYTLAGDLNGDCMVDLNDLVAYMPQWMMTGCVVPNGCVGSDITGDGRVGLEDLAVIAADWMIDCTLVPGDAACKKI
jgi:hypothetical protein